MRQRADVCEHPGKRGQKEVLRAAGPPVRDVRQELRGVGHGHSLALEGAVDWPHTVVATAPVDQKWPRAKNSLGDPFLHLYSHLPNDCRGAERENADVVMTLIS